MKSLKMLAIEKRLKCFDGIYWHYGVEFDFNGKKHDYKSIHAEIIHNASEQIKRIHDRLEKRYSINAKTKNGYSVYCSNMESALFEKVSKLFKNFSDFPIIKYDVTINKHVFDI